MRTIFYIDRQFGHTIQIDVKNGKIVKFHHGDQLETKLNERYLGAEISTFKKEFEEQMSGTYHDVRSAEHVDCLQISHGIDTRERSINNQISLTLNEIDRAKRGLTRHRGKSQDEIAAPLEAKLKNLQDARDKINPEKYANKMKLEETLKMLEEVHNFKDVKKTK